MIQLKANNKAGPSRQPSRLRDNTVRPKLCCLWRCRSRIVDVPLKKTVHNVHQGWGKNWKITKVKMQGNWKHRYRICNFIFLNLKYIFNRSMIFYFWAIFFCFITFIQLQKTLHKVFLSWIRLRIKKAATVDPDPHWEKQLDQDPQKVMQIHNPDVQKLILRAL